MKALKAYEFRAGWGSEDETIDKVNDKIKELDNKGIKDVGVEITGTGKGVMYTLIWDE